MQAFPRWIDEISTVDSSFGLLPRSVGPELFFVLWSLMC